MNTPDDWSAHMRTCPACGNRWHLSEGPTCHECEMAIEAEVGRIVNGIGCFNDTILECWRESCKGWDGKHEVIGGRVMVACQCGEAKRFGKWRR